MVAGKVEQYPEFDTPVQRRGTWSSKWDKYQGQDVLPFWVADMEFPAPPAVIDALHQRTEHGVFGYTRIPDTLTEVLLEFLARRYAWQVSPDWLVWLPGVVPGLNLACRVSGEAGDTIITAVPIYYPFLSAPENAGRRKLEIPLLRAGERWEMDLAALAAGADARRSSFLLCNPQNPTGQVYTRAELTRLAELCCAQDLLIIADEIHAELIHQPGVQHLPIATLAPEVARRTITLLAPSKTFNIPGLAGAWAIIADAALRRRFIRAGQGLMAEGNPLSFAAAEAAYRHGEPWRQQLLKVLRRNHQYLLQEVNALPGLSMTPAQATCLAWIDAHGAELDNPQAFFEAGGAGLSAGTQFGGASGSGDGFLRFNFGCSWSMLQAGLARMAACLDERGR